MAFCSRSSVSTSPMLVTIGTGPADQNEALLLKGNLPVINGLRADYGRVMLVLRDEIASVALSRCSGPKRSQHHRGCPEAAYLPTRCEQADQAARGRARVPDIRARGAQPDADNACGSAGDRPGLGDPPGGAKRSRFATGVRGR